MSKKEFEDLLKFVLDQNPELTKEAISVDLGYNEGFIFQMLSRGKISDKFLKAFTNRYLQNASKVGKKGESWEPPVDDLIEDRVVLKTLLNHVLKIEAVLYNRPLDDVRRDFKLDTNLLLDQLTDGAASKP